MSDSRMNMQGDIPEFHRLVGEAIRAWASVEGQLWLFVEMILGVDQMRARIVMASISGARAKREFIARLAETYVDASLLPELRKLLDRLKRLGHTRNVLAHSLMHVNVDGKQNMVFADVFSEEMDGGLDFDFRLLPLNEVKVLVEALHKLHNEMVHFIFKCSGHVFKDARVHRDEAARKNASGPQQENTGLAPEGPKDSSPPL